MLRFLQLSVVGGSTGKQLLAVNLRKAENHLRDKLVDIGKALERRPPKRCTLGKKDPY